MTVTKYPAAIENMLQASAEPSAGRALVDWVVATAEQVGITFTPLQLQVLTNHLLEMQGRAHSGERLPPVDPALFAEVSPQALALAEQVVAHIGHLGPGEQYVLSIHFEAAQSHLT